MSYRIEPARFQHRDEFVRELSYDDDVARRRLEEWDGLHSRGWIDGVVLRRIGGPLEAIATGGFLAPHASRAVLEARRPWPNRTIADIPAALLPDPDREPARLARESAGDGAHLHLFHFEFRRDGPPELIAERRWRMAEALHSRFAGARLRAVTLSFFGDEPIPLIERAGFRIVTTYPDAPEERAVLAGLFRSDYVPPATVELDRLFAMPPPTAPLSDLHRRFLYHLRQGAPRKVAAQRVFLSEESADTTCRRIAQKLRLAGAADLPGWLEDHPQECWPAPRSDPA